ncbi:permease [Sphingobium olei]|uniref:Permease n=1 Tax=Sphingobium olei TaxID=420955 RepID=A0ABW3P4Y8_9SPHN|nr:small multi-drug resistant family protein [Sphingobium sp.]
MSPLLFLLIIVSVSLSAAAQLVLKIGVGRAQGSGDLLAYLFQPLVIGGLALYGIGAILWLSVLARAPLSMAYPFVGLGFILTMVFGLVILGENVTPLRVGGTLLIAAGCVLVARS